MSSNAPTISVVMSVYNGEKYIRETIESILNQSYKNFEFIIINDCSTDSSLDILEKYHSIDDRLIIINNERNLKLPASLNRGIDIARGKYIARVDADDICCPSRFEIQLQAMEQNPDIDFIGARVECFYDEGNVLEAYADISSMENIHFNFIADSLDIRDTEKLIRNETYKTTRICHSTLFGKTSAFKKVRYNEEVFAEDWDLYNRAINRKLKISKVPDVLVKYRIVNSGMCGQFNSQSQVDVRRKIGKLNSGILKDCFDTHNYNNAFKFYFYHYIRVFILTLLSRVKGMLMKVIKRPVFYLMKRVYKSMSDNNLKRLYSILTRLDSATPIRKLPLINRVFSLSILVLSNNKAVMPLFKEKFSTEEFVNISVWTIEKKWAMGGLSTILKMIPSIIDNGKKVRIINYGLHSEEIKKKFIEFLPKSLNVTNDYISNQIEVISASTYRNNVKDFNTNDIFIAGFWEPAEDFIKYRKLKHFINEEFVYIIQDFEPSMLYRWGSEYVRSLATLNDSNYYPIYNNSIFVCGYMKKLGIIDSWNNDQILHGEPCNTTPLPSNKMNSSDIKIVFYARPSVDKNIYQLKVEALKMFIDYVRNTLPHKYSNMTIVGIGEDAEDVDYGDFTIKNLGKVSYDNYPTLLNEFNIGLSCIISPAFAYPCIEFPRAGLVSVVNKFENRDLSKYSKNIISCDNNVTSIYDGLIKAVSMIDDTESRYKESFFTLPGVGIQHASQEMIKRFAG